MTKRKDKTQLGEVKIKKVGPLWVMEGEIVMYPEKSYPLKGYKENTSKGIHELFEYTKKWNHEWWEKFPECCESHKRFYSVPGFKKDQYPFMKNQAYLSIRYFVHCIEVNLKSNDWFRNISEYYDYLKMNFGSPGWGDHIFERIASHIIENITFEELEFDDEKRLMLLEHILPSKKSLDENQKNNGKLEDLYIAFQSWLKIMPSIGEIALIKQKLTGKIPMNIFIRKIHVNQFNGLAWSSIKTVPQLVEDLKGYTKSLLLAVQDTIEDEFYQEHKTMFALSEERLRIRQSKIFSNSEKIDSEVYDIITQWLESWIDYFKEITIMDSSESIQKHIKNSNKYIRGVLEVYDVLNSDIAELKSKVLAGFNSIDQGVQTKLEKIANSINKDLDILSEEEKLKLQNTLNQKANNSNEKLNEAQNKIQKSQISVKSKIKLSLPIFLFTKFESELEVGVYDKIPSNLKELKQLLLQQNQNNEMNGI